MATKGDTPALKRAGEKLLQERLIELNVPQQLQFNDWPEDTNKISNQLNLFTNEHLHHTVDLSQKRSTPETQNRTEVNKTDNDHSKPITND